ncbi:MAG: hypothetical protein IH591_18875 [Bacteroidales bacterium]|nr:hypothetical protein [Bacteroidales bacterium]
MEVRSKISKINIPPLSYILCNKLLDENTGLSSIIKSSSTPEEANKRLLALINEWFTKGHEYASSVAKREPGIRVESDKLRWDEIAAIRIYDYLVNAGKEYENLNKRIKVSVNDPFVIVWLAFHRRKGGGRPEFFHDMIHLFRQFSGKEKREIPSKEKIDIWMDRFPTGTTEAMVRTEPPTGSE